MQPLYEPPGALAATTFTGGRGPGEAPRVQGSSDTVNGTWIRLPANLEVTLQLEPGARAGSIERRWRENGGGHTKLVHPAAGSQLSDPITHTVAAQRDNPDHPHHSRQAQRVWGTTGIKHCSPPQSCGDPIRCASLAIIKVDQR